MEIQSPKAGDRISIKYPGSIPDLKEYRNEADEAGERIRNNNGPVFLQYTVVDPGTNSR